MKKLLFTLLGVVLLASCGEPSETTLTAGTQCYIHESVWAADTKANAEKLTKYAAQKDELSIKQMIAAQQITTLMPEFTYIYREGSVFYCKLEVTDLLGNKYHAWVARDFVSTTPPDEDNIISKEDVEKWQKESNQ